MKNYLIIGILILLAGVGYFIWSAQTSKQTSTPSNSLNKQTFSIPKKSAHYESNTPAHGATLGGVPINVVIDFNFDLAKPSEIKILNEGKDYGVGETIIDSNKLAMRRKMANDTPNGLYNVEYKACWPDGSCHEGNFQFVIDRTQRSSFEDRTKQSEITIKMSDIKFMPMDIKISKGTKITWVNDDNVEHYVNTDSHPAHTYYSDQNSKALKRGDTYSLTFNTPGIYPYHCSAHASSMIGSLLVE